MDPTPIQFIWSKYLIFMLAYFLSLHPLIQSINTSIDPASNSCPKSAWLLTALLTSSAACSVYPSWNPQQATPALCTPFRQSFGQPTSSHRHMPAQASHGGSLWWLLWGKHVMQIWPRKLEGESRWKPEGKSSWKPEGRSRRKTEGKSSWKPEGKSSWNLRGSQGGNLRGSQAGNLRGSQAGN